MRKGKNRRKALIITLCVLIGLGLLGTIGVLSTISILKNQYNHVNEMVISDISAEELMDGDYEGEYGYGKNMYYVKVTVLGGEITSIDLAADTKESNLEYVDKASVLIDDIIETQSISVDCVSGATRSSKSILKAVQNALSQ